MRRFRLPPRWRRYVRWNQASQGLVEYGMIVAVVGVVSLVGLNLLTQAQQGYWENLPSLAAPTPQPGTWVHSTHMTSSCPLSAHYTEGGPPLSCTVTIQDMWGVPSEVRAPLGTVIWTFDTTPTLCTLVASPPSTPGNPSDRSTCVFTHPWTLGDLALPGNPHQLSASYATPNILLNHQGSSWGTGTYTLDPVFDFALSAPGSPGSPCKNPWKTYTDVEIGHPLDCALNVTDHFVHTPSPGVAISLSATPPNGTNGDPSFACFSNNSYVFALGCPPPAPTMTCTTDAAGQCRFVYRRAYDASKGGVMTDQIAATATVPGLGGFSQSSIAGAMPVVVRNPEENFGAIDGHPTGTFVQCAPASGFTFLDDAAHAARVQDLVVNTPSSRQNENWVVARFQTARQIHHPGGVLAPVTCTAIVFDGDPNPIFDANPPGPAGCGSDPVSGAAPEFCNPDTAMAHAPMGFVAFNDPTGTTTFGTCQLGHSGSRPTSLSNPVTVPAATIPIGGWPIGQAEYASWCPVTFNTSPGPYPAGNTLPMTTTMHVDYLQETSFGPAVPPAHAISSSPDIDVNFN